MFRVGERCFSSQWVTAAAAKVATTDSSGTLLIHNIGVAEVTYFEQDAIWTAPMTVPEPATMLLLGSGLIGLAGYGRKRLFRK